MTPVARQLQALADRRGVSPALIAKTPEAYARMLAKIGLDSQDLPSVVPDAEALDRQIWRSLQERIENFNLNVEIVNLCKNRRISCYKTNGKSNNMAQSHDQTKSRKGQAPMVNVQKSQLVALFIALGFKAAADWNNERFQKKIEGLDKSQDELDLDDLNKDQKKLLKQLLAASKDDEEVRIDDDDEDDKGKVKKDSKSDDKSGKGKKGKSSKDDDEDEEEDEDDDGESDDEDEESDDDEEDEEDDEPSPERGKKDKSSKSDDDEEDEDESEDEEDDEEEGNDEDSDSSDLAARLTALEKKIDRLLKLAEGNGPKSAKSSAKDDDSDEDESDDDEDEEDDDDEEEETPKRKGKKSGKSSGGGVAKVSEVLEYVSNVMRKANSEDAAIKPADVLAKIVKKFDTRDEDWLKEKLAAILPGKLSKEFKLKKTKDGRYWTQKK